MNLKNTKGSDLQKRADNALMPLYPHKDVALARGEGCYVFDTEGEKYLDCAGGIAVTSLGHNHPVYNAAIADQLKTGLSMCIGSFATEPKVAAAELLTKNCTAADQIFFCNSGAEAVEGCIKLARTWAHHHKNEDAKDIICFHNSFHGRTYGAVSATEKSLHQPQFAPYMSGYHFADFNDLDSVKTLVNDKTCAILIEPVQGEGGLTPADPAFLKGLEQLCQDNKILLISDEVQAGMGRLGTLFAHDTLGYTPDLIALAKGLGGGFPVGAFMARGDISKTFKAGDHGTTYGGNPLATKVVHAVVSEILSDGFLDHAQEMSAYFKTALETLQAETGDIVTNIRGQGLMIGIETKFAVKDLLAALLENGLLATQAGSNTLRLTPPLIIQKHEIDDAIAKIKTVLTEGGLDEQST